MESKTEPPAMQGGGKLAFLAILAAGAIVVGTALTIGDAIFMSEGAKFMAPGDSAPLMGLMAIAGAIGKAIWLPGAAEFLKQRLYAFAAIAIIMGCFLHAFSMVAMTGLVASGRDASISARSGVQEAHSRAVTAYDEAVTRSRGLRAARSEAAIRADILKTDGELVTAKADLARAKYNELPGLRARRDQLQARRDGLTIELEAAAAYAQAQADVTASKAALDHVAAPLARDPQAEAIARYGIDRETVAKWLPLIPSLLVEFGGGIFFLLGGAFIGLASRARAVPVAAVPVIETPVVVTAEKTPVVTTVATKITVANAKPATATAAPRRPVAIVTTPNDGDKRIRTPTARVVELTPTILRLAGQRMSGRKIAKTVGLKPTVVKNVLAAARSQGLVTNLVTTGHSAMASVADVANDGGTHD